MRCLVSMFSKWAVAIAVTEFCVIAGLALSPKFSTTSTTGAIIGGSPTASSIMLFPVVPKASNTVTASYIHNDAYLDEMLDSLSEWWLAEKSAVIATPLKQCLAIQFSDQLHPEAWLGQSSAFSGDISSLCVAANVASCSNPSGNY